MQLYCWHAPQIGALKFGYTTLGETVQGDYDRDSLITLECPVHNEEHTNSMILDSIEAFGHRVLEDAGFEHTDERGLFLLNGTDYDAVAFLTFRAYGHYQWLLGTLDETSDIHIMKNGVRFEYDDVKIPAFLKWKFDTTVEVMAEIEEAARHRGLRGD